MEQFLPFIIFILIAILFNRNRLKNTEEKQYRTPPINNESIPTTVENKISQDKKNSFHNNQDKTELVQTKKIKQDQVNRGSRTSVNDMNIDAEVKITEKDLFINDANDLVKGIILSEILGPPRAKQRYGRR